jgi:sodium/hydrogen antiporter
MGMGGLAKEKAPEAPQGEPSEATNRGVRWPSMGFLGVGGDPAERARKKSMVEEEQAEDDRHIRFNVDGVGQRLTKEDFIRKMQGLDAETRRQVVDESSASHVVKTLAKQDPQRKMSTANPFQALKDQPPREEDRSSVKSSSEGDAGKRSESWSPTRRPGGPSAREQEPGQEEQETAVERRRRLSVLRSQGEEGETPAERRRREAALGMMAEDDSDDEGTERVPPTRRGIRFADDPDMERGRK